MHKGGMRLLTTPCQAPAAAWGSACRTPRRTLPQSHGPAGNQSGCPSLASPSRGSLHSGEHSFTKEACWQAQVQNEQTAPPPLSNRVTILLLLSA